MYIKNILDRTFDIFESKCLIKNNFIKKTTIMQYMYIMICTIPGIYNSLCCCLYRRREISKETNSNSLGDINDNVTSLVKRLFNILSYLEDSF